MSDAYEQHRGISLGDSMADLKPKKALRLDQTPDFSNCESDPSQGRMTTAQQQQVLHVSRRSSRATDQSRAASNEPQLPVETRHLQDMSRYVNQLPFPHTRIFRDDSTSSYRPSQDRFDIQSFDASTSFQSGTTFDSSQEWLMYPESPSILIHGPAPDTFPPVLSPFDQWTQSQPTRPDDTGLT